MAKPLRPKRGTTAKNDAFTGLASEITVDTDKHSIRVHDGLTPGGHEILPKAKNDELYAPFGLTIGESKPYGSYDGVDLNTIVNAGVYFVGPGSTALNFPTGTNGVLVVYSGLNKLLSGPFVRQVFYRIGTVDTNDFEVFTRTIQIVGSTKNYGKWYQVLTSAGGVFNNDLVYGTADVVIRQSVTDAFLALRGGNSYPSGASLVLYGKDAPDTPGAARFIAHNGTTNYSLYCYPDGRMTWAGKEVERVNTINTKYIRYENGIQIVWGSVTVPENVTTTTLTLPVAFSGTNYCICFTHMSTAAQITWAGANKTTTTVQVTRKQSSSGSVAFASSADYVAIGRWK